MARQKLKAKDKKTQKITKNGLVENNQETGKQNNISNKVSDFSLDKKQSKKQNTEKIKEEKQGGRTARLTSLKKKQQRKQIQQAQLENKIKSDIPLYEQNFSELENNNLFFQQELTEESQQKQQYQPTKSNAKSDLKKRIAKKAIVKKNKTNERQIKQKLHDISITKSEKLETAEIVRKNDFSFQQSKQENNHSEFQTIKKEEQKPQKLKLQNIINKIKKRVHKK